MDFIQLRKVYFSIKRIFLKKRILFIEKIFYANLPEVEAITKAAYVRI